MGNTSSTSTGKINPVICHDPITSKLIVYGCLRKIEPIFWRKSKTIPLEIKQLILLYFHLPNVWSEELIGKGFEIDEHEPAILRYTKSHVWGLATMEQYATFEPKDANQMFEWEFMMDKDQNGYFSIMFGFVSANIPMEQLRLKLNGFYLCKWTDVMGTVNQPCGVWVYDTSDLDSIFRLYGRDGNNELAPQTTTKKEQFKCGDRFRLLFDFKDRTCALYYNGKFVQIVYHKIKERLILLLATYAQSTFICTKCGKV